jgi:hypothetical protein
MGEEANPAIGKVVALNIARQCLARSRQYLAMKPVGYVQRNRSCGGRVHKRQHQGASQDRVQVKAACLVSRASGKTC